MMRPCPKPQAPERGGKLAKLYMSLVAQLPCVCCGRYPSTVHHTRHGRNSQGRSSDYATIPLCYDHHQGPDGLDTYGSPARWKSNYGLDTAYIAPTRSAVRRLASEMIGGDFAALITKLDELEQEE